MSAQLPLDFEHRPALGREDFLVGAGNREAVAWIDAWPDWPARGLVIFGPPKSGKTHLAGVWQARSGALALDAAALTAAGAAAALGEAAAVAIDDAERCADERALLHLFNLVVERRGHLLLTAAVAPARWGLRLPDLASRLSALPAVGLGPPDEAMMAALLAKLFSDRQVEVGADVVGWLVLRLERTGAAAVAAVDAIDRAALARGRKVSVAVAREVLRQVPE